VAIRPPSNFLLRGGAAKVISISTPARVIMARAGLARHVLIFHRPSAASPGRHWPGYATAAHLSSESQKFVQAKPISESVDDLESSIQPVAAAPAELGAGAQFAGYTIQECIGEGGMARVYRARHEGLHRDVALKVLTSGVLPGAEARARFLEEARIAAAIKHPNVVNIFDVGVFEDVPYLVMELLEGQDLDALLRSEGALLESEIVDIALPIVAGLIAVHAAHVVHRDLKPGNIFLSRGLHGELVPKLLDFGISKLKGGANLTMSSRSRLIGTPLYMSPEALLGEDMTALSDQYSLGVILYECATGVNPFAADSLGESMRRITTGNRTKVLDRRVRPSRRLGDVIEKMLSLEPERRFQDLHLLGQELLTLAARRTRMTWALTFDPNLRPAPSALVRNAAPAQLDGRRAARPQGDRRLVFLGAALSGWLLAISVLIWAWSAGDTPPASGVPIGRSEPAASPVVSVESRALRPPPERLTVEAPHPALETPHSQLEAPHPAPEASPASVGEPPPVIDLPPAEPRRRVQSEPPRPPRPPRAAAPVNSINPTRARSGRPNLGTNAAPIFD
jgi:serine/threonine protein kinase